MQEPNSTEPSIEGNSEKLLSELEHDLNVLQKKFPSLTIDNNAIIKFSNDNSVPLETKKFCLEVTLQYLFTNVFEEEQPHTHRKISYNGDLITA